MPKMSIPATTIALAGRCSNGDSKKLAPSGENYNPPKELFQANCLQSVLSSHTSLTGNRCGHDKNNPRFYCAPQHNIPTEFKRAIEKLKTIYFKRKSKFAKRFDAINKHRQKRSERLEAIISVSQVLVHYLEAWTLRAGYFKDDGEFTDYTISFIAKQAGIAVTRARRALRDIVRVGYLNVKHRCAKLVDGTFKGYASARTLSIRFFADLGIDYQKLRALQEWKRKRNEKRFEKASKGNYFVGGLINVNKKKKPAHQEKQPRLNERQEKALVVEALRIHKLSPQISLSEIYKRLKERLLE